MRPEVYGRGPRGGGQTKSTRLAAALKPYRVRDGQDVLAVLAGHHLQPLSAIKITHSIANHNVVLLWVIMLCGRARCGG